jgi:hypothetical protein
MLVLSSRFNQQRRQIIAGIAIALSIPVVIYTYSASVGSPSNHIAKHAASVTSAFNPPASTTPIADKIDASTPANCTTNETKRTGLAESSSPQLKKLAQYEAVCGSAIVSQMSFFVPTPTSSSEARADAADVAAQLHEFAKYGVTPLVFFEPSTESGPVSLANYRAGKYDAALDTYFDAIKQAGVTDAMMGTWVPIPEGNLPEWTSLDPAVFAGCVTKAVTFQKKHFPGSKASVMLDTLTYTQLGDWDSGHTVSLLPYVRGIPAGLIDSFGLQGFPWSPPSYDKSPANGRPQDYLRVDLAAEAAHELGTKNIWLNSGTFGTAYAGQNGQVTVTPTQRLSLLNDVVTQIKTLQGQGFTVAMHLFSENKSHTPEAIDWSYWPDGNYAASPSTYAFRAFVHNLQVVGAPLWLFDTTE